MRHEEDPSRQPRCTQHGLHRQQLGVGIVDAIHDGTFLIPARASASFVGPIWPIATTVLVALSEIVGEGVLINDCAQPLRQVACRWCRCSCSSTPVHTEEEHTCDEQYMCRMRGIHPAPPCMRRACTALVTSKSTVSGHRREGSVSLDSSPVQSGIFPNV